MMRHAIAKTVTVCLFGWTASAWAQSFPIELINRTIHQSSVRSIDPQTAGGAQQYYLVQFSALPRATEIQVAGIMPVGFVDDHTLVLQVPAAGLLAAIEPLWVGRLARSDKFDPLAVKVLTQLPPLETTQLLITFFRNTPASEIASVITQKGGTVLYRAGLPAHVALVSGSSLSLEQIGEYEGVSWIAIPPPFLSDGSTMSGYCDGAESEYGPQPMFSTYGDGWDGPGLGSANNLLIRVKVPNPNLPPFAYHVTPPFDDGRPVQEQALKAAFSEWARYVEICGTITTLDNRPRSVDAGFFWGDHGDGSPFDSSGGVLAHGFFPTPINPEPIAGDIHFDRAEVWWFAPEPTAASNNYDFFAVALHELGHALGLGHSTSYPSVMYPTIPAGLPWLHNLTPDDISGIQSIYKARPSTSTPPACMLPIQAP